MSKTIPMIAVLGFATTMASADRVDLFVFENADGADVSGLSLWVDVIDQGTHADLVFHNDSSVSSFVRSIYIEGTDFSEGAFENERVASSQPTGVKFVEGGSPPNPAGSIKNYGGDWNGNLFKGKAKKSGSGKDGIDAGEEAVFQVDYEGPVTFAGLIADLTSDSPSFRIAQHVQGLPGGSSIWTLNKPGARVVPLPSAAAMGLAGLGLLAGRHRR